MSDSHEHNPSPAPAGRLSSVVDVAADTDELPGRLDRVSLIRTGILAVLFVALHYALADWLVRCWLNKADWSHGFLIPLFSLYLVYSRWQEIQHIPRRPYRPGLVIMVVCLLGEVAVLVSPLRNLWVVGIGMTGMLLALVLYLTGPRVLRVAWLPIVFLVFAIPLPASIYGRIAYPLQELAAEGAVLILQLGGVAISREASNLTLTTKNFDTSSLTVAEACSGMRLLMAFMALGVAAAYVETRPIWQRVVLVLAGVPIAVLCNVIRVTITCYAYYRDEPELGQDVLHTFTGMLMLIPAFGMLYLLGWVLNRMHTEDDDEEEEPGQADPPASPVGEGGTA